MRIILVTATIQISLRTFSVEAQASFLYYVRGGCSHNAPLSFVCQKVHLMWPQTQTDHWLFKKKNFGFEDSRPRSHRQFLDHEESTFSEFGHAGRMVWIELVCLYLYKWNDTYSMCDWRRLRTICAFETSLSSQLFVIDLFTCSVNLRKVWPNKILVSLRINIVNLWRCLEYACVKRKWSEQPVHSLLIDSEVGWSGGAMVLGKLPVPGRPTILITVGQGPIALAIVAGGGGLDIFTLIYPLSSLSLSLGDGPI